MTTPEALRAAPRTRDLPPALRGAPSRDFDAPFDPRSLALWDEGLSRLEGSL